MHEFLRNLGGWQVFELGIDLVFFGFVFVLRSAAGEQALGVGSANDVLDGFEIDFGHEAFRRLLQAADLCGLLLRHAV